MTANILRTTTTAAIADPVTKHHMERMADATALALATTMKNSKQQKQHLQNLDHEDRVFGFRRQQQLLHHGNDNNSENNLLSTAATTGLSKIQFQTKVSKSLLDETSLILSSNFLGGVAAQYQPQPPPPFVPVSVVSSSIGKGRRSKNNANNTATSASDFDSTVNNSNNNNNTTSTSQKTLPEAIPSAIPPLDVAAPARNLCIELLATRVVACVKAMSLLLQEFSSSPGQSLPHVGVLGPGNVGHTVLTHLVKLLPADRIVILARDAKSPVCNHFSTKYGVRALSTNILRDERLVDVIKTHRNKLQEDALNKQRGAGLLASDKANNDANNNNNKSSKAPFFGASTNNNNNNNENARLFSSGNDNSSSSSSSHVAPEVAAAQNISVALQQIHILVVCCRPAQISEVASSLQPWLRSSSVVVLSTLVGVTADRVAALFKVPASLSVTVDTNEMLFDFESRSRLHARSQENAAAAAKLIVNLTGNNNHNTNNRDDNDDDDCDSPCNEPQSVVGVLMNMNRAEAALALSRTDMGSPKNSKSSMKNGDEKSNNNNNQNKRSEQLRAMTLLENQRSIAQQQQQQLRFFTREPLDFIHRFYFALVSTLLERCGVGTAEAWLGVANLLLLRSNSFHSNKNVQIPKGIGAQGPGLVAKCSVQTLASSVGLSVGEVMRIIDERMVQFATGGR